MTSLLFVLAIFAALTAMGLRRYRAHRRKATAGTRPGAHPENAIYIRSFSEMDDHLRQRWCACGGFLEPAGEGSREADGHRYRVARMLCQECDETCEIFFETTDLIQ